ncbi:isobutyryl-CoA dehydrogenase [Microbacterium mitrae]|uniref:Acyl-CoA dehydrogenase n=1 Tax=Microbacterium mitrae TaxID=664640 RepID=A0A5C8HTQ2_9MICO|nr:acyl-CoA dehydrogenase family protein [Microbacterium mitrae]TXK06518.1 acyl-CoA dehydrogenase [Microbacterium mitrae]
MSMTTTTEEELSAILDAVRDFAASEMAPYAAEWDEHGTFPRDTLQRAGELGLGGIYVAEDVGGAALSRSNAAAIFESLAYADPTITAYMTIHNMVGWMIDTFGTEEQRQTWLPGLTAMDMFGAYCLTEPGAGSDAAAITTSAIRSGDEYVLTGVKQFISGAGEAGVYVVMARTGEPGARGITAFLVPGDSNGLSFGANEKKMGWKAQPTRQVILDEVRVPTANVLGEVGGGFKIAMRALNGGRINIAACSLGGAAWALDKAAAYVKERFTFGEPLAARSTVQFTLADMATELRAARALVREAARSIDEGSADAAMLCAMAKRFATDAGFKVANDALQLHGGYGYLADYGIEKIVRDLRVHQILEGTNEIMRVIIGREVLEGKR